MKHGENAVGRGDPSPLPIEDALRRFALLANKSAPHPRDWHRFYDFIVNAHRRRIGWDSFEIVARLKALGFDDRHAREFAEAYWHGRCVLHLRNARGLWTTLYRLWMRKSGTPLT